MLGAIIGDVVGSRFEWHNIKSKEFELLTNECRPTDDSIMTLAIAKAILSCDTTDFSQVAEKATICMQELGRRYPYAGYGGSFRHWLRQTCKYVSSPKMKKFRKKWQLKMGIAKQAGGR